MNPSSAPASNENVAYGSLLAQASKLKRSDQVNLVRALAGQVGMIAVFPNQLVQQAGAAAGGQKTANKQKGPKGPAQRAPTNPLSGSPEKKAFDAAKKAVAKATKESGGQKLPETHPLVRELESRKDEYFRSLSRAKGSKAAPASRWADEAAQAEASAPQRSPPKAESAKPSPKAKETPSKRK